MAKGKGFFQSRAFKVTMSKVYGIGAAVVIIGAMFKILHLPGANYWIGIGLTTEALIFFISSFEPLHEEPDWTLVYPELAGMEPKAGLKKDEKGSVTKSLDKMLEEAKIEQNVINRLGDSLRGLTENVSKMTTVSDAALATNDYAEKVKVAAGSVSQLNAAYANAIQAIEKVGQSGDATTEYYEQVQSVTSKLASLNSIYEVELQESNNHMRQLNNYFGSLAKSVENLTSAEGDTARLKDEFGRLSNNLSSLNNIYGNMLSAMSAPRS
jgi:gliding motility-associated protein GldL